MGGGINGDQLAVRIRCIQAFRPGIKRQPGAVGTRICDGSFQLQRGAIHHPNHALFAHPGDVNRVARVIRHQLSRLQRFHRFAALATIEHQTPFHVARFRINGRHRTVDRVTQPQGLRRAVEGCTKRFEIAMNGLRDLQRGRIKTIDNPTLVSFTALRRRNPQRILLLADRHFIGTFTHCFTQHLFGGMHLEGSGKQ